MSENFRGALIMMVCMSAFVLNDAFIRMAGNSLPLAQILFLRGLITTIVLLAFAIYGGVFSSKVSKKDKLVGLKENVIVGRLIPAGTGGATQQIRRVASDRDNIVIEARAEEERQAVALAAPTEESEE